MLHSHQAVDEHVLWSVSLLHHCEVEACRIFDYHEAEFGCLEYVADAV